MEYNKVILLGDELLRTHNQSLPSDIDFGTWARTAAYVARQIPKKLQPAWLDDWATSLSALYDDFQVEYEADPMLIYRPRNQTALEFHQSLAFVRYFRAGNRTSKTQSGYAEHYFCVTGHHPYRPMPEWPASSFIVCGQSFTDYCKTYEKKFISGEDGIAGGKNPLSPMFPEGGKWLYKYDAKTHIITLACPECAAEGKAGMCPGHHKKATISLVSVEKPKAALEAFSARLGHGDEHIPDGFYDAMKMRVSDQGGYLIYTGTPLHGLEAWEHRRLTKLAEGPPEENLLNPDDPESPPRITLHHCSRFDGNIATKRQIEIDSADYDKFEYDSRILGIPAPLAKNPVFDREILESWLPGCEDPRRGELHYEKEELVECAGPEDFTYVESERGKLRVWDEPKEGATYMIIVDTAAGLSPGQSHSKTDPSCATVFELIPKPSGTILNMVAQYHGWITLLDYAEEVYKLGTWYNEALVVVELTGGYGRAVVEVLKGGKDGEGLGYWNLFRDVAKGEYASPGQDARFGVDTTAYNKAPMVGACQHFIRKGRFKIRCRDTIQELVAYEQEKTEKGNAVFRGAGGAHDDRAMTLIIGASILVSYPVYATADYAKSQEKKQEEDLLWEQVRRETENYQEEHNGSFLY